MKEKVSLTIDGDVWRQFRAQCIQQKKSASSEIESFMKKQIGLKEDKKK